jgi:O-antigen/teichoic acid export membrane protein
MHRRLIRNLSFTTLQLIVNQALGLVLFFVLSEGLDKPQFGELNWSLSVFLLLFTVLSFGLDAVVVRRLAVGAPAGALLSLYGMHVLLTGICFYGVLLLLWVLFPSFFHQHSLLLLLGVGKLLFYGTTPFKAVATGREEFGTLFQMSVAASLVKALGVIILSATGSLTPGNAVLLFVAGDGAELLLCILLGRRYATPLGGIKALRKAYADLLREALHPFGTTLFAAALARLDWICIGLLLSPMHLANYSFAYKAFELATLPLLAIAPLLVPLFTRLGAQGSSHLPTGQLFFLLKLELMAAALVALLLNIGWVPLVETFTSGRYGTVNTRTVFILSLAMPVLYLNNFLWSLHFARGRTRFIFYVFGASFGLNAVLLLVLLPLWGNEGAALAYLVTILAQTVLYLAFVEKPLRLGWQPLLFCCACALTSGVVSKSLALSNWIALPASGLLYLALLVLTLQFRTRDWQQLKQWAAS